MVQITKDEAKALRKINDKNKNKEFAPCLYIYKTKNKFYLDESKCSLRMLSKVRESKTV